MLRHLLISDFAIVPSLELEFVDGFTAITGETGAGKSILVGALGLLLGDRSDSKWVRAGADKAELSAEFTITSDSGARRLLADAELGDGDICLLRRVISANGRSRAFINGSPVTLAQLQALGNCLVEIHGQHEHLMLVNRDEQFRLLDGSGDYGASLIVTGKRFSAWRELEQELEALAQATPSSESDLDYLRFQLRDLQTTALPADAVRSLEKEHDRLARGGSLLTELDTAVASIENDENGVAGLLHQLASGLAAWAELDDDIASAKQMLTEAAINCDETLVNLRRARDRVDLDPARLRDVSGQLGALHDLARKHQVAAGELESVRDRLADRLEKLVDIDARREQLVLERDSALAAYRESALRLSEERGRHAVALSERVTTLMGELGMPGGMFRFDLSHDPQAAPSARGDDRLELLVSANPGVPPGLLKRIASGGELSRISLAIKVAALRSAGTRTQIFDEVDAGIGGDTANAVGRLLKSLASDAQVLCVTHLAQVAACATAHRQVSKRSGDGDTQVDVSALTKGDRIDEIARMLSGRVSEQSRAHAAELLQAAAAG